MCEFYSPRPSRVGLCPDPSPLAGAATTPSGPRVKLTARPPIDGRRCFWLTLHGFLSLKAYCSSSDQNFQAKSMKIT